MKAPGAPVFYDPSGRRRRRFAVGVFAFAGLLVLAAAVFAVSIGVVPAQPLLPISAEHANMKKLAPPRDTVLDRTGRTIGWYARRLTGETRSRVAKDAGNVPLAIGFHVPWDEQSVESLRRHVNDLDWVIPGWVSITGADHRWTLFPDTAGRAVLNGATRRPLILPMFQNALAGNWDGAGMAALLHDPRQRAALLDRIEP